MKEFKLWENGTPYFDETFEQPETSITPFLLPVEKDENGNVKKRGCVIVCPGGSYVMRADHEGDPVCKFFNAHGLSAFTLNYRVFPYDYFAIRADVNRAVRWVRYHAEEFGIDPNKIALLGFSAGGHLATMGSTNYDRGLEEGDEIDRVSCRPDAALLCYAVISLIPGITHDHTRFVLIGRLEEELREKLATQLSGELAVTEDTPPTFIWHTADDDCVKVENAIGMSASLAAHKIPFELHIFDKGCHGLGLAENCEGPDQWPELAANWLKRLWA